MKARQGGGGAKSGRYMKHDTARLRCLKRVIYPDLCMGKLPSATNAQMLFEMPGPREITGPAKALMDGRGRNRASSKTGPDPTSASSPHASTARPARPSAGRSRRRSRSPRTSGPPRAPRRRAAGPPRAAARDEPRSRRPAPAHRRDWPRRPDGGAPDDGDRRRGAGGPSPRAGARAGPALPAHVRPQRGIPRPRGRGCLRARLIPAKRRHGRPTEASKTGPNGPSSGGSEKEASARQGHQGRRRRRPDRDRVTRAEGPASQALGEPTACRNF